MEIFYRLPWLKPLEGKTVILSESIGIYFSKPPNSFFIINMIKENGHNQAGKDGKQDCQIHNTILFPRLS
jgi:hypothetical protein